MQNLNVIYIFKSYIEFSSLFFLKRTVYGLDYSCINTTNLKIPVIVLEIELSLIVASRYQLVLPLFRSLGDVEKNKYFDSTIAL